MDGPVDHISPNERPLFTHQLFESSQSEEVTERLTQFYNGSNVLIRPARPRGLFGHKLFAARIGKIEITSLLWPHGVSAAASGLNESFDFCSSLGGQCEIDVGNDKLMFDARQGVVFHPDHPMTVLSKSRLDSLNVKIPREIMERQVWALTGRDIADPLRFEAKICWGSEPLAGLLQIVTWMAWEVERDQSLLLSPLVAERFSETVLTTLLYAQQHNYSDWLRSESAAAAPSYVRLVEDYLEAHGAEAISMPDLAEVAGVPVSTLYAGFRRYRSCTPLEFLRDIRLRRVRDALVVAPIDSKVCDIARRFGFTHAGRFSRKYAELFGELPSNTLRRGD